MQKLTIREKFGYGLGDTASNIVFLFAWTSAIAGVVLALCFRYYRLNREWAQGASVTASGTAR